MSKRKASEAPPIIPEEAPLPLKKDKGKEKLPPGETPAPVVDEKPEADVTPSIMVRPVKRGKTDEAESSDPSKNDTKKAKPKQEPAWPSNMTLQEFLESRKLAFQKTLDRILPSHPGAVQFKKQVADTSATEWLATIGAHLMNYWRAGNMKEALDGMISRFGATKSDLVGPTGKGDANVNYQRLLNYLNAFCSLADFIETNLASQQQQPQQQ